MKQEQENQKQQFGTGLCRHLFQEEVDESGLRIRCVPVKGGVIWVSDHELNLLRCLKEDALKAANLIGRGR